MENHKKYLFLVVLGGRAPKANIELHDVRWVIGSKIEETFNDLRKDWFGSIKGLHIDSYKKISSVDGFKINLKNKNKQNNHFNKDKDLRNKLWFVNIGGYDPSCMQEKHEFGFVVAETSIEAKNKAKSKWLIGCQRKHKDDISCLKMFSDIDDCEVIKDIGNWEIKLTVENNFVEETTSPDWFGYKRIDKSY
tara:strand:- start:747 stop:1322 length:576 start_codon:yes stop_codon:yes gene_type:complete